MRSLLSRASNPFEPESLEQRLCLSSSLTDSATLNPADDVAVLMPLQAGPVSPKSADVKVSAATGTDMIEEPVTIWNFTKFKWSGKARYVQADTKLAGAAQSPRDLSGKTGNLVGISFSVKAQAKKEWSEKVTVQINVAPKALIPGARVEILVGPKGKLQLVGTRKIKVAGPQTFTFSTNVIKAGDNCVVISATKSIKMGDKKSPAFRLSSVQLSTSKLVAAPAVIESFDLEDDPYYATILQGDTLHVNGRVDGVGNGPVSYYWLTEDPEYNSVRSETMTVTMVDGHANLPAFLLPTSLVGHYSFLFVPMSQDFYNSYIYEVHEPDYVSE